MLTFSWTDDVSDYPLTYAFGFYQIDDSATILIKPRNEGTSVLSVLSQGLQSLNNFVTCVVLAYDVYDDFSSASLQIKVNPILQSAMANALSSQMGLAFQTSNVEAVSTLITAATSTLNSVDCSKISNCGPVYSRKVCSVVTNTCGPCLPGFMGIAGDANSACFPNPSSTTAAQGVALKSTSVSFTSTSNSKYIDGSVCKVNSNCFSGSCFRGRCRSSTKPCPNQCSNNGVCVFLDYNDNIITSCPPQNFYCRAKCNCKPGTYGSDCSITSIYSFQTLRGIKDSLCTNLYKTLNLVDLTPLTLIQRSNMVSSILLDVSRVSQTGFIACAEFLISSIENAVNVAAESAPALSAIYSALSDILNGDEIGLMPAQLKARLVLVAENLARERQKQVYTGQLEEMYISENVRALVTRDYLYRLSSAMHSSPLSVLEQAYNISTTKTTIAVGNMTSLNSHSAVGLSVSIYSRNILELPKSLLTSPFFGAYYTVMDDGFSTPAFSQFRVNNSIAVNYSTPDEFLVSGRGFCTLSSSEYNISLPCARSYGINP